MATSIDLSTEKLLSLAEAGAYVSKMAGRPRPIAKEAMWRWHMVGRFGVCLSAVQVCGKLFTTERAINEFLIESSNRRQEQILASREARVLEGEKLSFPARTRSDADRAKAIEDAKKRLAS